MEPPGGQRVKADRHQKRALELVVDGQSYQEVELRLGISKKTVPAIVKRHSAQAGSRPTLQSRNAKHFYQLGQQLGVKTAGFH